MNPFHLDCVMRRIATTFFQAARLLEEKLGGAPVGTTPGANERVRFRSAEALAFPGADVKAVEPLSRDKARIVATFMGLYGVDAPLPVHLHEAVTTDPERAAALRDFLDVFNNRIYAYFYRAWKRHRPEMAPGPPTDDHQRRFLALAGLATPHATDEAPVSPLRLAAYAGFLADWRRTPEGLRALVGTLVDDVPVTIEEHVPRWIPIAERPTMGGRDPARLGSTASVGQRMLDRSGKVRIGIGPLDLSAYQSLLPRGDLAEALRWVVRLYLPDFLDFDLELTLEAEDVRPVQLGDRMAELGRSTFVGHARHAELRRVVDYSRERGKEEV